MNAAWGLLAAACAAPVMAVDFSSYRGLELGGRLGAVAKRPGIESPLPRTIHSRPGLIQELDWRPPGAMTLFALQTDSVRGALLRFHKGELFQIIVTYERQSVEGLTDADMVEAISRVYGAPTRPATQILYHSNYAETAAVLARWGTETSEFNLVRTGDGLSYSLVLSETRLATAAQAAITEAERLDALEAPQRELVKRNERDLEARNTLEKTRAANKPKFRP